MTTVGRRWCQVQDNIGKAGNAGQASRQIEVGQQGLGTGFPPVCSLGRIAQQGMNAWMRSLPGKKGKNAAGDVPAADDQYFLHAGIVAGAPSPGRRFWKIKGIA